ncbi:MAG TPA: FAD-linked oxidase C-terminal domain-containing protein [Candidatus Caenarcaniphilales bacterium]|nr:FAD-linked oxidase C-terminal domain-containing protein [Candidatus Caenarcaniphilales bacterium]
MQQQGSGLLHELARDLPHMRLLTDAAETEGFRFDETEYMRPGNPLAVCFPTSTADVQALVRAAAEHGVPLVPRGAGTGLSGGAVAVEGALTVVFTAMDRVLEIDPENLTVTVEPGVINAELGRAVAQQGLFYPPDPASFEMCTIGGNLAENSGGLRCVKYGVTRDFVLGLEVVLADGSVIRTGGKNVKDVAGYDLTGLFVGSEGTLGLITEATLRLLPAPATKLTLLAFFDSVPAAGDAVARITAAGVVPVTLELMDAFTIAAVDDWHHLGLDRTAAAMLMVESDAPGALATEELATVEAASAAAGATSIVRAADAQEADWLRQARRAAHGALERAGVARMDDVGVPRSRIPEMLAEIDRVATAAGLTMGVFGHAGDGNLHPTYIVDRDDPSAERRIDAARDEIYRAALALGGTVTGEHGTGITKRRWLEAQRGPDAVRVMRAVKQALDPAGLFNPGKVLL